jgi:hypothetical protein
VAEEEEEEMEKIIEAIKPTEEELEEAEEEKEEMENKIEAIEEELEEAEEEEEELEMIIEVIKPMSDAETTDSETKADSETTEGGESTSEAETTDSDAPEATVSGPDSDVKTTAGSTNQGAADDESSTRYTYSRRGQPMKDKDQENMRQKWGSWTLVDDKERPTEDFYKNHPNRDIPRSEFPSNAWQIDKEYLAKFLPEGIALAQRTQEAILAEYGQPMKGDWEERSKMFLIEQFDTLEGQDGLAKGKRGTGGRESLDQGGWTTKKSWEGLKKRLLHAVMTEDWFVFAMGGHSAAAGHG